MQLGQDRRRGQLGEAVCHHVSCWGVPERHSPQSVLFMEAGGSDTEVSSPPLRSALGNGKGRFVVELELGLLHDNAQFAQQMPKSLYDLPTKGGSIEFGFCGAESSH